MEEINSLDNKKTKKLKTKSEPEVFPTTGAAMADADNPVQVLVAHNKPPRDLAKLREIRNQKNALARKK